MRRRLGFKGFYAFGIVFFVRMRVGFERFYDSVIQLLCAGAWVLSDVLHSESVFVRRHMGFKGVHALRIDSCAQACGFSEVQR